MIKNNHVSISIEKILLAPAISTIPLYINIFPIYNGFLVYAKGPDVHNSAAPTVVVLVIPPAWLTAQNRIDSPKMMHKRPRTTYAFVY